MKKIHLIMLLTALAGIAVFESCKKYEDGPGLSFRSRTERVANTWKVSSFTQGGVDATLEYNLIFPNAGWTFDKNGKFTFSFTLGNITTTAVGSWEFQGDDFYIVNTYVQDSVSYTDKLRILKLKETEMWLRNEKSNNDASDDDEYHFTPK